VEKSKVMTADLEPLTPQLRQRKLADLFSEHDILNLRVEKEKKAPSSPAGLFLLERADAAGR
jgi:hypothetical protein